jgi:hypothetical protein
VDHEVEVVVGARQEGVSLVRLDDERIAFVQLDRVPLDADRGRAAGDDVDLCDPGMDVRLIDAFARESDRDLKVAVPRAREPTLRVVGDPLASHAPRAR